ncbi:hypothetical protein MMC24_005779 [Lignoscripta atroalba]|nr:hypothetical protein [Lignoscripta atroalba]
MTKKVFEKYDGGQVTDSMLQEASRLFSENYGVWGKEAAKSMGTFAKEVRTGFELSAFLAVLHALMSGLSSTVILPEMFHRDYRERRLATGLLTELREDNDDIYGIMSSHAASCLATANVFGRTINAVDLGFITGHAEAIIKASPISYVKDAKLHGSLFDTEDANGLVSCVDTGFFVDHTEPLEALASVRGEMDWPLGELIEGHEFLLILEGRRRARATARSKSASKSA